MDSVKSALCGVLNAVFVRPIGEPSRTIEELPKPFEGSLVIQLWFGKNFRHLANELLYQLQMNDAYPSIESEEDFERGLDSTLKGLHAILAFRDGSMLDALKGDEIESNCDKILAVLLEDISKESRDVNLVYFLNSVRGTSFSIASQNIHLVQKGDTKFIENLKAEDSSLSQIDINEGTIPNSHDFERELDFNFAIIIKGKGSFKDAKTLGEAKLRILSSVIHAFYFDSQGYRPAICSGKQRTTLLQLFKHPSGREDYGSSHVPSTFPAYCRDVINLDSEYQLKIQKFFLRLEKLSKKIFKNKMSVCLHNYSLGLQSNSDIAFIHYFIALDALYGTDKGNRNSIIKGILSLKLENFDEKRAERLYRLRGALIHGGIKSCKDWINYRDYLRKYKSEPFSDLQRILATAIVDFNFHKI